MGHFAIDRVVEAPPPMSKSAFGAGGNSESNVNCSCFMPLISVFCVQHPLCISPLVEVLPVLHLLSCPHSAFEDLQSGPPSLSVWDEGHASFSRARI